MAGGVFIGRWADGKLTVKRAKITGESFSAIDGPSAVASCEQFPQTLYATCAKSNGLLHMIVRSGDGGHTWAPTKNDVKYRSGEDIRLLAGAQGAGSAPMNCIAVMPSDPALVAFGWTNGPFISTQEGNGWEQVRPVHHPDIHALMFKPMPDGHHILYIGSDGGLASVKLPDVLTPDIAENEGIVAVAKLIIEPRSDYNQRLATLQCYSPSVARHHLGTMSVSPFGTGWLSTGVHDNGNIYCHLSGAPKPWHHLETGDGGWTGFMEDGGLVTNIKGQVAGASQAIVGGGIGTKPGFAPKGVVPITVPSPGDPKGLVSPFGDVVREPSYGNAAGQVMLAAAGSPLRLGEVYGLFQDGSNPKYHWERLGTIPENLKITATGSMSGRAIMVAAEGGRMFLLNSAGGAVSSQPVILPQPSPDNPHSGGNIPRVLVLREDVAFAILNTTSLNDNYILRLEGAQWTVPLSDGLPRKESFFALAGVTRGEGTVIFAATDDKVYLSEDAGEHWVQASGGLPRRSHCADLQTGSIDGVTWLFLSTFGRSVWRTHLSNLNIH
jgi:hypothetical protein